MKKTFTYHCESPRCRRRRFIFLFLLLERYKYDIPGIRHWVEFPLRRKLQWMMKRQRRLRPTRYPEYGRSKGYPYRVFVYARHVSQKRVLESSVLCRSSPQKCGALVSSFFLPRSVCRSLCLVFVCMKSDLFFGATSYLYYLNICNTLAIS